MGAAVIGSPRRANGAFFALYCSKGRLETVSDLGVCLPSRQVVMAASDACHAMLLMPWLRSQLNNLESPTLGASAKRSSGKSFATAARSEGVAKKACLCREVTLLIVAVQRAKVLLLAKADAATPCAMGCAAKD